MKFYSVLSVILGVSTLAACAAPAGDIGEPGSDATDHDRSAMDMPPPPATDGETEADPAPPPGNPPPGAPGCGEDPTDPPLACGSYGGRAYVLGADVLGIPVRLSDTGALPAAGGDRVVGLPDIDVLGVVDASLVTAKVKGANEKTDANATVADVKIDLGGLDLGGLDASSGPLHNLGKGLGNTLEKLLGRLEIHADAVTADANATCDAATGRSTIANLTVNGGKITVSGQPNQVLDILPGNILGLDAKIIVNEQISTSAGDTSGVTVNALHVKVKLGNAKIADVIVSSADASVQCCID